MRIFTTIIFTIGVIISGFSQYVVSGRVIDEEGNPLIGANAILENTYRGDQTESEGYFTITGVDKGDYLLIVSYVGYRMIKRDVTVKDGDLFLELTMKRNNIISDEVTVYGTRANDYTPIAKTEISNVDLENTNLGQDIPYLLEFTPSTVVTSDAGNGIGYTGIRIRGTDPTRVNVTINGVPLNDSESQGVFWVNLPDFASSTQNIQIQRGVGTSTNGAGAFGASVNLLTNQLNRDFYAELNNTVGSFNTFKNTLQLGSGLIADKFTFDGRISRITSDGYIDRASSDLFSYYLSGAYYGKNQSLRLNVFHGHEVTYQAWYGISADLLETDRTFNPAGTERAGEPYENQVDDYTQTHYQLVYNNQLNSNLTLNTTAHYTRGLGFFEEYKAGEALSDYGITAANPVMDLVRRRWLDNDFYGVVYSLNYVSDDKKVNAVLGGGINQYLGDHFGQVIQTDSAVDNSLPYEYYQNDATKNDFNIYARTNYQLTKKLNAFIDLQYRRVTYSFLGLDDNGAGLEQTVNLNFFNPKVGATYDLGNSSNLYGFFGVGNKEPNRNDYTENRVSQQPIPETLYNVEAGYRKRFTNAGLEANYYYMYYRNQLALTGELNIDGAYIRTNIDRSFRTGLELSGYAQIIKGLVWRANATFSQNKVGEFIEFLDSYDGTFAWLGQETITHENTDLAFSPNFIAGSELTYDLIKEDSPMSSNNRFNVSWQSKYVGQQFIDNTSNTSLDAYWTNDIRLRYGFIFGSKFLQEIDINFLVRNITNELYVANAWSYRYLFTGDVTNDAGFYPQAGRNFLVSLNFKF